MTEKKLTIDGIEYDFDALSDHAKAQIVHLKVIEAELLKLNTQIAIYETAQNAYLGALKEDVSN